MGQLFNKITNINDNQQNRQQQQRRRANENDNQNENELLNVGDVAAILFFLLSVQSGLSSLNGRNRIEKFFKNYTLLFIAILHYLHNNLDTKVINIQVIIIFLPKITN